MFGGFTLSYNDLTKKEQQEILNKFRPDEDYEITSPPFGVYNALYNAKYRRQKDGTVEVMW